MNKLPLFKFLLFIWILLITYVNGIYKEFNENNELILVQALWRHGDRSPTGTFKTDKYQEDDWPQGWGQITPKGMAQHVELGKRLRKRYIKKFKFVSSHYNNHEIYIRSTDWNRTLISAISNLIGFYGPGTDQDYPKDLGSSKWPGWYVPIPIHSLPGNEDFMAPGETTCKRYTQLKQKIRLTPEYNQTLIKYKWLLDFLSEKIGQLVDPFDMWLIDDAFYIEKLKGKPLVDWAEGNQTLLNAITQLDYLQEKWISGLDLNPMGEIDFKKEFSRMLGGPILWKLITNIQEKLICMSKMNLINESDREIKGRTSPLGSPLCKWMNKLKYIAYSAHDSTIVALFSALGFQRTNYDQDGYPHYSTCVTIELWREKNNGKYSLKVLLWKPSTNENSAHLKDITDDIEGCRNNRSLDQFIARSKKYQMLPTPKEYCSKLFDEN